MDIPRPDIARRKTRRRLLWGFGGVLLVTLATVALARLEPAAPSVERDAVWIGTVERGEMVRRVRGPGSLVPVEVQWITAPADARVERVLLEPGVEVQPDTVLLELANPELEQEAREARIALEAARADLSDLKARLQTERLEQESAAASLASELKQAEMRRTADERLAAEGLLSDLDLGLSRLRVEELHDRNELESRRLASLEQSMGAQVAAQRSRLSQLESLAELRLQQVAALDVRAGIAGVLQQIPVEPGQRVNPGTLLARVADVGRLQAELRIPETQARDVQVGLPAEIDTRNGIVAGRVSRVDPAVENGTVTVDVTLEGELPRGARPDLSVDGTITLERLENVLSMRRPTYGQPDATIGLYRLTDDGGSAVRVPVRLGRSSVDTIEVVEGLSEGDRVILSDTSGFDDADRVDIE